MNVLQQSKDCEFLSDTEFLMILGDGIWVGV